MMTHIVTALACVMMTYAAEQLDVRGQAALAGVS